MVIKGDLQISFVYVTHSLFGCMIAMIARHTWWSRIFTCCFHTLSNFLESVLSHLDPLGHVTNRGVLCESINVVIHRI